MGDMVELMIVDAAATVENYSNMYSSLQYIEGLGWGGGVDGSWCVSDDRINRSIVTHTAQAQ